MGGTAGADLVDLGSGRAASFVAAFAGSVVARVNAGGWQGYGLMAGWLQGWLNCAESRGSASRFAILSK